jgi:hypothetical protein
MRLSDDDKEFLHNIIREGTQHPPSLEDDMHPRMTAANISTMLALVMLSSYKLLRNRLKPRYMEFMHIYMNSLEMKCVY